VASATGIHGFLSQSSIPGPLLNYPHGDERTSFQTHYFFENLVAAPGIDTGTSGSVATNSNHYNKEAVLPLW
jgi:hypothetical protein